MLTTTSYYLALAVLVAAALIGLRLIATFLPSHWSLSARWGLLGVLAGILITPALPSEDAATLAPALIVGVFNTLFAAGWPTAVPAVARLVLAVVAAGTLGAITGLVVSRIRAGANHGESAAAADAQPSEPI